MSSPYTNPIGNILQSWGHMLNWDGMNKLMWSGMIFGHTPSLASELLAHS